MEKQKSFHKDYSNVIMFKEEKFSDFTVSYELTEAYINNEKSFCLKLSKKPIKSRKPPLKNNEEIEEAVLPNFESRKETAISIYNALVRNKVTPMCLYDSVLELI